jgi:hypothetical protein
LRSVRSFGPDKDDAEIDYLEERKLVCHSTRDEQKKPVETSKKWDYYVAPLSPLSDLTESEASDSDDDNQLE